MRDTSVTRLSSSTRLGVAGETSPRGHDTKRNPRLNDQPTEGALRGSPSHFLPSANRRGFIMRIAGSRSMRFGSKGGSERERKLASALVAIAAHLIAEIRESHAVVWISEGELPARAGMAEAPRA